MLVIESTTATRNGVTITTEALVLVLLNTKYYLSITNTITSK